MMEPATMGGDKTAITSKSYREWTKPAMPNRAIDFSMPTPALNIFRILIKKMFYYIGQDKLTFA